MKRSFLFILVLLVGCSEESCITGNNEYVEKNIHPGNFQNVSNAHSGSVKLMNGEPKIHVSAEENIIDLLKYEITGNTLKIGSKGKCFNTHGIHFEISSESFNKLTNDGSADWTSDSIEIDPEIESNGSGNIELTGNSNNQKIISNGSGDVNLTGMPTKDALIENNGSGKVSVIAYETAEVTVNGSGDIVVDSINGELTITINGSGNVLYSGDPKKNIVTPSGSGQIIEK